MEGGHGRQLRAVAEAIARPLAAQPHDAFGRVEHRLGGDFVAVLELDDVVAFAARLDSLREVLAFAFEASLMAGQTQQNIITRRLAAWAAILAVPTAVAGIYGMNFEHMPELKWAYGYYVVVGGILSVCTLLYVRFRHYGWL